MGLGATEDPEQRRDLRGSGALRRPLAAVGELWGGAEELCWSRWEVLGAGPGGAVEGVRIGRLRVDSEDKATRTWRCLVISVTQRQGDSTIDININPHNQLHDHSSEVPQLLSPTPYELWGPRGCIPCTYLPLCVKAR